MTAQIIQFVPKPNPRRKTLEEQAIEFVNAALLGEPHERAIYESSLGFIYEKDPA